jgi:ABC-type sulfate/molybdate transport systems ATPase subunit
MLKAQIVKKRRDFTVHVALQLAAGESLALFGPSGSGKSTVLACIAGVEEPDAGSVALGEQELFPPSLPLHQRPIGYLTQEPGLFPHLTVADNVQFGISRPSNSNQQWIGTLRDRLGLNPLWHAPASRISGGQARRVALARMLARKPALVLLDEPFTGLDRQIVRELIEDLLDWSRQIGFSMIAVDHQAEVLERLCPDRVIALESGSVVQEGRWEDLRHAPATEQLRSLLAPL